MAHWHRQKLQVTFYLRSTHCQAVDMCQLETEKVGSLPILHHWGCFYWQVQVDLVASKGYIIQIVKRYVCYIIRTLESILPSRMVGV